MRGALALLVLVAFAALARADAPAVHMSEPREFGHFVGDTFTRTAEFEIADGETFVAASLPHPGQLAYWLELRDVKAGSKTVSGKQRLTLALTYQIFYVPIDTRRLTIPASNVEIARAGGQRTATMPAFIFLASPIREIYPEKSGETTATFLKADATAARLPTGPTRTSALVSGIVAALALLLLARHRAWWPFHRRPDRPFTEAARAIADHRQSYAAALVSLHRAFDRSQGERLLAGDLERFFARRPEQIPVRQQVDRFFSASRTFFFAGDQVGAEAALPRSALERLAADLGSNERVER